MNLLSSKLSIAKLMFLLLVIICALAFSTIEGTPSDTKEFRNEYNDFYPEMPSQYSELLSSNTIDEGLAYETFLVNKNNARKVVFIKKTLSKTSKVTDFVIQVFPIETAKYSKAKNYSDKTKSLDYKITKSAVQHKYNGANYLVIEQEIPFIEIAKIKVSQPGLWEKTIEEIDNNIVKTVLANSVVLADKKESKTERIDNASFFYKHLFRAYLDKHQIKYNPSLLFQESDAFVETYQAKPFYAKSENISYITVKDQVAFWTNLTQVKNNNEFKTHISLKGKERNQIKEKLEQYNKGEISISKVFDVNKIAQYYALLNLFTINNKEASFYLNTKTGLLEPIYFNEIELGKKNALLIDLGLKDKEFYDAYVPLLTEVSNQEFLEELLASQKFSETIALLAKAQQLNPSLIFDQSVFLMNQEVIRLALRPSSIIKAELVAVNKDSLAVNIKNLAIFPVAIDELLYKGKKKIQGLDTLNVVPVYEERVIVFNLPRSFENLFVQKKTKTTGFVLEKNIFDLKIAHRVAGANTFRIAEIIPYLKYNTAIEEQDVFRSEFPLPDYIVKDEENKTITFAKNKIQLNKPLIIPEGFTVVGQPGLEIDIIEGGKIISRSPFQFKGTQENKIKVYSSDEKGQGILVIGAKDESYLEHVLFDHLSNPSHGNWNVPGAVTFYESPVFFNNVISTNNHCEDAINFMRTSFRMINSEINKTQSDAFDGDFVEGTIKDCKFKQLGNDGIDVSGSKITIENVLVDNAGDKGLSAGENSQMIVKNVTIRDSEIAVAGKDLSVVTVDKADFADCKLAFTAFQKKPEFGPSVIKANEVTTQQVEVMHLIEMASSLVLEGKEVEPADNVKARMYGAEFGVSSKETRVRK